MRRDSINHTIAPNSATAGCGFGIGDMGGGWGHDTAAHAVAVGFVVAAAVFTLAVAIGAVMLPRSRSTDGSIGTPTRDRTRPDDQSVGPSDPSTAPV